MIGHECQSVGPLSSKNDKTLQNMTIQSLLDGVIFLSNSSLSLVRLGVDFVLPLSQEEQQQEQEPSPKISAVTDRILMKL